MKKYRTANKYAKPNENVAKTRTAYSDLNVICRNSKVMPKNSDDINRHAPVSKKSYKFLGKQITW